jgi:hypothetical protein
VGALLFAPPPSLPTAYKKEPIKKEWEFNIKTGCSLFDPSVKVTTYDMVNGHLVIEIVRS